jgi:hypothetical protein
VNVSKNEESTQLHKNLLQSLTRELSIEKPTDWFNLTPELLRQYQADHILRDYDNSIPIMISQVFPEYKLFPWQFKKVPRNFWASVVNQKQFIDWLSVKLNINKQEDWYRVTYDVTFLGIFSE